MILFLDFDGVLHPFPIGPIDRHFMAMAPLWAILDEIPEVSVVITSTWRERHSFKELLTFMKSHGGGPYLARFLGVTPILENASNYVPGIRQREIESWLQDNGSEQRRYLILDDIEEYFDATCQNLHLVDGTTGLTEDDARAIVLWFKSIS